MTGLCLSVCIHDSVQKDTHVVSPQFLPSKTPRILPRSSPLSLFMPLRITPWYVPGESAVTTLQISAQLQAAMAEVTNIISSMLSVRTSESPLLLSRDISRYCRSVWRDPSLRNYNRCGSLDVSYSGESCLDVMIPDSHLQGFAIWPANGNEPIQMIPDGTGVPDTDFLLYVRVAQTIKCAAQPSVIAYASFCQLDSSGRPIAGVIVFCMERLKEGDYQHSHIVQASLHELLHALGFSNSLFEYWTDCSFSEPGGACSSRSRVSNTDEHGQFRIYTPTVTQKMGEHFGEANVGAPLENKDFPSSPSSHWESRILQGSILTASLSPPHLSLLDPITLAAFTDMGWYGVNTSFKGQLVWGRDAGPSFGQPSTCHDSFSDFFCTGSEIGCHHLHLDKGICTTDAFLDGCRIYKPLPKGGECWLERNGGEPDEIYHAQSRCFFSNITKTPPYQKITGRCYLHQCLASNTFQVKVQGSEWMDCPSGQWVQVAGFEGFLKCPSDRLCMGFPYPPAQSPTAGSSTIHSEATREVNITSNQSMEVRVLVTLTQSLEGSTEKIMLLLDEVLDVISQVAEVQRCLLHVPSQIDLGSSFTLTIRSSHNCPSPAV
ncbi:ciliated left-right organizer metallopeptidase [Bombina bombina]|uniref:ciliated left-right organizer metallopeptidase n=1 Tax=Bombina bombina TaxID=8345 RepID=UPI00235A8F24|nr:ciliated left-right organizer metallopeptidase [Bombina bombina]